MIPIFNKIKAISLHPLEKVLLSFILLILTGTFFILLPFSTYSGISFIDALFTSTSAVCVTGLIVLDTAKDFTLFGQAVILLLIQFGGFGIMTFSLGLVSLLGKDLSVKWRYTLEGMYSDTGHVPVKSILKRVIKYTFIVEITAAAILFTQFNRDFPFMNALGHAVFHAVSAFCNAGFSTFSDSLMGYQNNIVVNMTVSAAVITGGLGFIVLSEISRKIYRMRSKSAQLKRVSIHTKIILIMTAVLLISGTVLFFVLEKSNTLQNMGLFQSVYASFFQSMTCRTAGFNTVDIAKLHESTLFMMICLMFIGGSPGSIAGGIKTTTMCVIILLVYSKFKGRTDVSLFGRSLDHETVDRSITLFILSVIFIIVVTFILVSVHEKSHDHSFLSVFFETVSAFGTVGLSMGITPSLLSIEKAVLVIVMLAGRLGLLSILMVFTLKRKRINFEYPSEHIMN